MTARAGARCRALLGLLLLAACHGSEPTAVPPTRLPAAATVVPSAAASPAVTPNTPSEALPRGLSNVTLGMSRQAVEEQLGALTCHRNPGGFDVCTGSRPAVPDVAGLEVYLYRDRVLSLTGQAPASAAPLDQIDGFMRRFGKPSLNGLTETDRLGRLHEIYGWKDEHSIYSVRFVWEETPREPRRLAATMVTVWDRPAYDEWAQDPAHRDRSTPSPR